MSADGKLGAHEADAAADALLAAPRADQQARRARIERRRDTTKEPGRVPAFLAVVARLFGLKVS